MDTVVMRWMTFAVAVCCMGSLLFAQNLGYTPRTDAREIPSYELVSIHTVKDGPVANSAINGDADGLTATRTTLRGLIAEAYSFSLGELTDDTISGLPAWAKTQLFDVKAKVDPDNVEKLKAIDKADTMMATVRDMASRTPSPRMMMLQRLLEERFKLKLHYEERVVSLYEMVVAKGGLKLAQAHPKDPEHGSMEMSSGKLTGDNVPMSFIPLIFGMEVGRPVEDKTGVSGNYDFELHWSRPEDSKDNGAADAGPSLFTALQEQMGLKLQPGKGPVWMIVVEHAEMPTEN